MTIGEQLRRARHARRLTVNELSMCTGVSPRAITSYETGTRDFYRASFRTVVILCQALGISMDDLDYVATHEGWGVDYEGQETLFED